MCSNRSAWSFPSAQESSENLQDGGQAGQRKRLKLPPNPSSTLLQGIHLKTAFGQPLTSLHPYPLKHTAICQTLHTSAAMPQALRE